LKILKEEEEEEDISDHKTKVNKMEVKELHLQPPQEREHQLCLCVDCNLCICDSCKKNNFGYLLLKANKIHV
jgi:hypothetical protein